MVISQLQTKLIEFLKKYRYVLIILLIGLILMLMPNKNGNNNINTNEISEVKRSPDDMIEKRLSELLSKVEGAGDVEVMLTVAAGEEIIYQTNEDHSESDTTTDFNIDTVMITDSNRNQTGLVKQVKSEVYQGAVIVCNGADDPSVRLAIVDAVSRVTGLGANCISVLKMK